MNILYCGDANMADGLLLSILSLRHHHQQSLHIYILTATLQTAQKTYRPLSNQTVAFLETQLKQDDPDNTIQKIDITSQFNAEMPTANMDTLFTPYCMLRLFCDKLPELPERLLYLDTDVICRQSLDDLYHEPLSGVEIAGVPDYYGRWFFHNQITRFDYLNSGVLLMNLKFIRQTGLLRRCRQLCRDKQLFMPDQSALNKLAVAKRILPRQFNEQRRLHGDTVLQHFTTSFRLFPWVHTLTVKPWQVSKMHDELGLHEYDALLSQYQALEPQLKEVA